MTSIDKENIRRNFLHNRHNGNGKIAPMPKATEPTYTAKEIDRIRNVARTGFDRVKISPGVFERVPAKVVCG